MEKNSNKSVKKQLLIILAVLLLLGIGYAVYWWNVVFPREFAEGYFGKSPERSIEVDKRREYTHHEDSVIVDSVYKKEELINGYRLQYKVKNSLKEIHLLKGEVDKVITDMSWDLPEKNLGHLYLDADEFFVIEQLFGSCIQHYNVYEKDTSATLLAEGDFFLYADKDKRTLILRTDNILKLYDHKLKHVESYDLPDDNPCICPECWEIVSLSDNSIGVTYKDHSDKEKSITIKRKY